MKNVFISCTTFVVMIFCILFSINYLNKICNEMSDINYKLEQSIELGNWRQSKNIVSNLTNNWEKFSDKLSIFVNHEELDNINSELSKLTQYINYKNKDESMASLHSIKFFIQHISKLEKINMQNIF
ncbi:DUF4363 family protein [Clostridium rectalis]|uniref:DUF4363 family protein n=1 Tax=Clostridium rectalis TaxID=2040295 RepID=UPI000F63536F|nr:DUF4363 family protein [Clostridium rectalis]